MLQLPLFLHKVHQIPGHVLFIYMCMAIQLSDLTIKSECWMNGNSIMRKEGRKEGRNSLFGKVYT